MSILPIGINIFHLSITELWLLLSQFAPAFVLGVENPYLGWLAEEIETANRAAVESLIERGLARPLTDETVDVDDHLLAMAKACTRPDHSMVVQISSINTKSEQRYIHFADRLVVEHHETAPGKHLLQSFASREALLGHLTNELRLNTLTKGRGKPFQLAESALYQSADLASSGETNEINNTLLAAGLTKSDAEALQAALTSPVANASLAVIANQGDPETQHVRGFGILEGAADLWLIIPFDRLGQPQVEFTPIDAQGILRRLEEVIPGCLLTEEGQ